jgi:hypothetical protein
MQKWQILFIHGGMTFKNRADYLNFLKNIEIKLESRKRWHEDYLKQSVGNFCDIIKSRMPLAENARYEDWKIYF